MVEYNRGDIMNSLICKCGNDMFNVATNDKFARCSECGTIYDSKGNITEVNNEKGGEKVFLNGLKRPE